MRSEQIPTQREATAAVASESWPSYTVANDVRCRSSYVGNTHGHRTGSEGTAGYREAFVEMQNLHQDISSSCAILGSYQVL